METRLVTSTPFAFRILVAGSVGGCTGVCAAQSQPVHESAVDPELAAKLLKVKRIFVVSFGCDKQSEQLEVMIINALVSSKRFIITEDKEKVDAVLKGIGLEKSNSEVHATSEGTVVGTHGNAAGIADSEISVGGVESAKVAVRLVSSDGDVLWSTTQESKGAKYKGAMADVADQIVKQLIHDLEKISAQSTSKP